VIQNGNHTKAETTRKTFFLRFTGSEPWVAALVIFIGLAAGTVWAQEQQDGSLQVLDADSPLSTVPQTLPEGTVTWDNQGTGQRKTGRPGAKGEGTQTTIILGEFGKRQTVTVIENGVGETGFVIGGQSMTPEERARLTAKENLQRNSVIDPNNTPVPNVNTTVRVESVIVQQGSSNSSSQKNRACVKIGIVGGNNACEPSQ